jgi:GDPmannose 4,6-dehydratase
MSKNKQRSAIITGVTGQVGSYLTEFLLEKDYKVYGLKRRTSNNSYGNINHLLNEKNFEIVEGDLSDLSSITSVCKTTSPDEFYNLAAQSEVGTSFSQPFLTLESTGLGVLNCLEAIKQTNKNIKFFQASTSEMFGGLSNGKAYNESSPLHPRSPYGCVKAYAHYTTINYRESYNMFACTGIMFNNESVPDYSPIIIKKENEIDILPISKLFKSLNHRYEGIKEEYKNIKVWDGEAWTKVLKGTFYKDSKKELQLIQTREACCETTLEHEFFDLNNKEVNNSNLKVGDVLFNVKWPENFASLNSDCLFAKFLGFVVGDGHISSRGKIRLTGTDKNLLLYYSDLVTKKYGWKVRIETHGPGSFKNCVKDIWNINISCDSNFGKWLRKEIYLPDKTKKIPKYILNSSKEVKKAFFEGYYDADGRKAGHEKYKFKGFSTNSPTLSLGLIYIMKSFSSQVPKCKCEIKKDKKYYTTQLRCENETNRGKLLRKNLKEIVKIEKTNSSNGWFYDIQTESGAFATGPNLIKIHNSPRRGPYFVTQKIATAAAKIFLKKQDYLYLGNLQAFRDWSHSKDIVRGIYSIMQYEIPEDFVLSSDETHSIEEFCNLTFSYLNLNYKDYVKIDPKFYRPAEVHILKGDSSKARNLLNWKPECSFEKLVQDMVESALQKEKNE